ncbi:MAG: PAS domain-containing protein [Thermodesulfobacteriota bacterium]
MNSDFLITFDDFSRRYWPLLLPVICLLAWWFNYLLFKRHLRLALFRLRHRQTAGIERRKRLEASEERLQVILSSILTGVAVINPENRQIEYVNPAGCRLLGGDEGDILGRQIEEFELAVTESTGTGPALLADQPKERQLATLQGDSRPVLENTANITINDRSFLLKSYLDLTEQAQAREEVAELNVKLSKRIHELNCLFGITNLFARPDLQLEELLQKVVELVASAMTKPRDAVACLSIDEITVSSATFVHTAWHIHRPVFRAGEEAGWLEVAYRQDPGLELAEAFSDEEILLVETVAQRLGRHLEGVFAR